MGWGKNESGKTSKEAVGALRPEGMMAQRRGTRRDREKCTDWS